MRRGSVSTRSCAMSSTRSGPWLDDEARVDSFQYRGTLLHDLVDSLRPFSVEALAHDALALLSRFEFRRSIEPKPSRASGPRGSH